MNKTLRIILAIVLVITALTVWEALTVLSRSGKVTTGHIDTTSTQTDIRK